MDAPGTGSAAPKASGPWQVWRWPSRTKAFVERAGGLELTLMRIPAGSFLLGGIGGHRLSLGEFLIGQVPITQAQWRVVAAWPKQELELDPEPASFRTGREVSSGSQGDAFSNWPVASVSWFDAREFCRRLAASTGRRYGLPSEARWEYAARAGSVTPFCFGEELPKDLAAHGGSPSDGPGAVARYPANAWGLHDVHGLVWEWCSDHWREELSSAVVEGEPWLDPFAVEAPHRSRHVMRGGSWVSSPEQCAFGFRSNGDHPGNAWNQNGFRVCCLPPQRGQATAEREEPQIPLTLRPLNGRGRNVITGKAQLKRGGSGLFGLRLDFSLASEQLQRLERLEVRYFHGATPTAYGVHSQLLSIDDEERSLGLDGHLTPPLNCQPGREHRLIYAAELLGRNTDVGFEGTDYGRGLVRLEASRSQSEVPFFLNPGGEMLLSHEQDTWHGPEDYY
jgi:formylglycine-generating enzyme required for sulfatase activity